MSSDTVYLVAGIAASAAAVIGAALAIVRFLTDSARSLASDRLEEIRKLRNDLHEQAGLLADISENAHAAEKEVLEREKTIASLESRPDTEQMLVIFEKHHDENLKLLRPMAEGVMQANEALRELLREIRRRPRRDR
jgi:hypothetical protein